MVLCDHCDANFNIDCLKPPLKAVPKAGWACASCKESAKLAQREQRKEARDRQRAQDEAERVAETSAPPSAYEQQRLDNMASNQKVLHSMGLGEAEVDG